MAPERKDARAATLRELAERVARDPLRFRAVVALLVGLVGWLVVILPMEHRVASARAARDAAAQFARTADAAGHYADQIALYESRAAVGQDLVGWQNYILEKLEHAGIRVTSFEPRPIDEQKSFQVVAFEIVAKVQRYEQIVDFVDRLEHGERLTRVEELTLTSQAGQVLLTCSLKGLVKPGATPSSPPSAPATDAREESEDA